MYLLFVFRGLLVKWVLIQWTSSTKFVNTRSGLSVPWVDVVDVPYLSIQKSRSVVQNGRASQDTLQSLYSWFWYVMLRILSEWGQCSYKESQLLVGVGISLLASCIPSHSPYLLTADTDVFGCLGSSSQNSEGWFLIYPWLVNGL